MAYNQKKNHVTSALPQWTVLGPSLFLVYINDLDSEYIQYSTLRIFADDCIIYKTKRNREDTQNLQEVLTSATQQEKYWLMSPHPDKCSVLQITTKQKPNKIWLHPSQTCHAERGIHKISPSDNTNMSISLQYQPHKRHPQNISEWQYKHVNKLTESATQKLNFI